MQQACAAAGTDYLESNDLILRRGPYVIAAGLDKPEQGAIHEVPGPLIDLFDPELAIVDSLKMTPGRRALLYRIDQAKNTFPRVLASSCKTLGAAKQGDGTFVLRAQGPDQTEALLRIGLPARPEQIFVDGKPLEAASWSWNEKARRFALRFPNSAAGKEVKIH